MLKSGYKIGIILFLLIFMIQQVLGADEFKIKLDKTDIKWGEVFTLEIEAKNPLNKTVQGGITVSFSSNLIVTDKDRESQIYYEGSRVFKKGHICCATTQDIMVENWYKQWPARAKKKMKLKMFVLKTGVLKIYGRGAFISSLQKKQVINFPKKGPVSDQQNYPVYVKHVLVKESPDFLRNFQLMLKNSETINSPLFLKNLHRLINNPRDKAALRFFGIENIKNSPDYLVQLKKLINNPKIVNSPDFMSYLKRVINDPTDKEALKFFGVKSVKKDKRPLKTDKAKKEAISFLENQRGGENLIALIEAEGDIFFVESYYKDTIQLNYDDHHNLFYKYEEIVSEIAKMIVRLKPDSEYIDNPEPMTNTSYRMLIRH